MRWTVLDTAAYRVFAATTPAFRRRQPQNITDGTFNATCALLPPAATRAPCLPRFALPRTPLRLPARWVCAAPLPARRATLYYLLITPLLVPIAAALPPEPCRLVSRQTFRCLARLNTAVRTFVIRTHTPQLGRTGFRAAFTDLRTIAVTIALEKVYRLRALPTFPAFSALVYLYNMVSVLEPVASSLRARCQRSICCAAYLDASAAVSSRMLVYLPPNPLINSAFLHVAVRFVPGLREL